MSRTTVGKGGRNHVGPAPLDLTNGLGIVEGERDGDVATRRTQARAVAAIRSNSRRRTLGGIGLRELIDEGRR